MSNNSIKNNNNCSKKSFFERLNQLFHSEPKNLDDLVELIRNYEQKDVIDLDTREMLEGVINISKERVRDIMIPRSQIVTLQWNQTLAQCLDVIINSAHSRFPVISEDKDHIKGLLMAKDLLPFMRTDSEPFNIEKVLRPVVVIPESKRVDILLKEFRLQRYHMAIVIDEFGGVSGLVTIEDILELIVGEIADEYDNDEDIDIQKISNHTYLVRAITTIDAFNKVFGTSFNYEGVDTIGGLLLQTLGSLPAKEDIITINGYIFKITIADGLKIIQVQVKIPDKTKIKNLL